MSRRKRARSNTSRTFAILAVYVLVSIALLGIVVKLRRESSDALATTQPEPAAMTLPAPSAAITAPAPVPSAPAVLPPLSGVQFADSSDDLPQGADARLARLAAAANAQRKNVFINAVATTGGHNEESLALARKRIAAVQRVLQANGLTPDRVHPQISQLAPGVPPIRLALVDLIVR